MIDNYYKLYKKKHRQSITVAFFMLFITVSYIVFGIASEGKTVFSTVATLIVAILMVLLEIVWIIYLIYINSQKVKRKLNEGTIFSFKIDELKISKEEIDTVDKQHKFITANQIWEDSLIESEFESDRIGEVNATLDILYFKANESYIILNKVKIKKLLND